MASTQDSLLLFVVRPKLRGIRGLVPSLDKSISRPVLSAPYPAKNRSSPPCWSASARISGRRSH